MGQRILVTGGTGKTGRRVAGLLGAAGIDARIGTRTPDSPQDRRFDWADLSTAAAFDGCDAAYLVAPTDRTDHLAVMRPMLEAAQARGVRRFVLLSSSLLEPGGPMMGEVHGWLANTVEWAVLRPSWFMQNFSEGPHGDTIRQAGAIYSATGDGRIGFIDAGDIAAAALAALTSATPLNADYVLTGPEALSYDDTAAILSDVIGRPVRHVPLDPAALTARFVAQGVPQGYAETLASLDAAISAGAEDRTTTGMQQLTGQAPTSFRAFAERAVAAWS
ncbi:ergot alkaloid biosynthesis protein [Frigidibacter albus]|uniref:Ergot alkaloid biosynthesis protein n=1 Tax=Frigidibacter albus TaxID=1465486 RepID=A0A6L8VE58_9RHOB|nr:ergot alkaloid biosynthesis protein [Frigidibacter albus]MZQ88628.1 ergot alkaloid biosynthesis protein [Frigidibacter albus]NBE30563.1 ergot alkaloid biosynthesis protein [Frigidibacter albus]GGH49522.1 oxidoreductase [Frigidibacter albus]